MQSKKEKAKTKALLTPRPPTRAADTVYNCEVSGHGRARDFSSGEYYCPHCGKVME